MPVGPFKAEVRIVNRLPDQESYFLGMTVLLEAIYSPDNPFKSTQIRTIFAGVDTIPFDVGLGVVYNATVWAETHEGFGIKTVDSFISYGDSKFVARIILKNFSNE